MGYRAILFGGIGTLVETSEMQRAAFNDAFRAAGLSWHWDRDTYRQLLLTSGGVDRIRQYRSTTFGTAFVSDRQAAALHSRKVELFRESLAQSNPELRRGIRRLINLARNFDMRIGIASTTSAANLQALVSASRQPIADFDVVLSAEDVALRKPDAEIYERCLYVLDLPADDVVAIEDSETGVQAAKAAGLHCIAMPGENTRTQDFSKADVIVEDWQQPDTALLELGTFAAAPAAIAGSR